MLLAMHLETSPHTRGKPVWFVAVSVMTRNIPAYAGKAWFSGLGGLQGRKHPRIRGESPNRLVWDNWQKETSPHTRGKPALTSTRFDQLRNIPAYAGKATICARVHTRNRKHPRIRGESHRRTCRHWRYGKHPRIRGESQNSAIASEKQKETSPHTRGKLESKESEKTDAEKHPRIRGESDFFLLFVLARRETSPHTRGKLVSSALRVNLFRNIPAYAGKARSRKDVIRRP